MSSLKPEDQIGRQVSSSVPKLSFAPEVDAKASDGGGTAESRTGGLRLTRSNVSMRVSAFMRKASSLVGSTIRERDGSFDDESTRNDDEIEDDGDESDDEEMVDRRRIHRAVRDAGRFSDGISAVEVWMLDPDARRLVRPDGGWWRDPHFETTNYAAVEALDRIENVDRSDHVPADSLLPGTGLAGKLWAESSSSRRPSGRPPAVGALPIMANRRRSSIVKNDADDEGDEEIGLHPKTSQPKVKGAKANEFEEAKWDSFDFNDDSEENGESQMQTDNGAAADGGRLPQHHLLSFGMTTTENPPPKDRSLSLVGFQSQSPPTKGGSSGGRCDQAPQRLCSSLTASNVLPDNSGDANRRRSLPLLTQTMHHSEFRRSMMMQSQKHTTSSRRGFSARNLLFVGGLLGL